MFTGLVRDVGTVAAVEPRGDLRLHIVTAMDLAAVEIGASICNGGCCLTVVEKAGDRFAVDVSAETLSKTTLGGWGEGTRVNLEPSLRLGDELGGHLVFGHVDGLARVVSVMPEGDSHRWVFEVPRAVGRYLAPKGSVALDGTSLTVNEVEDVDGPAGATTRFGINLIPHTTRETTFRFRQPGDAVNVEIDMLARYVARLTAPLAPSQAEGSTP